MLPHISTWLTPSTRKSLISETFLDIYITPCTFRKINYCTHFKQRTYYGLDGEWPLKASCPPRWGFWKVIGSWECWSGLAMRRQVLVGGGEFQGHDFDRYSSFHSNSLLAFWWPELKHISSTQALPLFHFCPRASQPWTENMSQNKPLL